MIVESPTVLMSLLDERDARESARDDMHGRESSEWPADAVPRSAVVASPGSSSSVGHDGPLLRIESISVSFRGVKAIDEVGFDVAVGEICALIGPNGAGKSTLLNVVSGLYRPQSGRVFFAGQLRTDAGPRDVARSGIARTFQNIALFKGMSVLDNVLTGETLRARASFLEHGFRLGRARGEETRQRRAALEVIERLDLAAHAGRPVGALPYGLQKRVELARALVSGPRLLLLDEPMAGMNVEEKAQMCEHILAARREQGTTILLIEHDMGVVMDLSDHVVVLDHGRRIADGTPETVQADPEVVRAYLGTAE